MFYLFFFFHSNLFYRNQKNIFCIFYVITPETTQNSAVKWKNMNETNENFRMKFYWSESTNACMEVRLWPQVIQNTTFIGLIKCWVYCEF